jgi:hypothetical protein
MKTLYITKLTWRSAKSIEYSCQKTSHILDLLITSTKPNICSLNIPAYSLHIITLLLFIRVPPLIQFALPQNVVLQKLLELNSRIDPLICSHKFDNSLSTLFSFGILEHSLVQSYEICKSQISEDMLQLNIRKRGYDTFFGSL